MNCGSTPPRPRSSPGPADRSGDPADARRDGATLSFELSEPAAVTLTVMCKKGRRYRALSPTMPLGAPAGTVSRRFDGKLGLRALKPGRYRLAITAVDAAGNRRAPGRRGVQDGALTSLALGRHTAMMSRIEMMPCTSPFSTTTR